MNLAADRSELAAILSTVDGVQGKEYRSKSLTAGDAFPMQGPMERGPANDFSISWRVFIVLPTDERKQSDWFASHVEAITEALDQFAYVERIEPAIIQTEAGDVSAMLLTMTKEA